MGVYGGSTFQQGVGNTPPPHPIPSSSSCSATSTIRNGAIVTGSIIQFSSASATVSIYFVFSSNISRMTHFRPRPTDIFVLTLQSTGTTASSSVAQPKSTSRDRSSSAARSARLPSWERLCQCWNGVDRFYSGRCYCIVISFSLFSFSLLWMPWTKIWVFSCLDILASLLRFNRSYNIYMVILQLHLVLLKLILNKLISRTFEC